MTASSTTAACTTPPRNSGSRSTNFPDPNTKTPRPTPNSIPSTMSPVAQSHAGDSWPAGLSRAGRAGPVGVHSLAAPRNPQRAAVLFQREPLGIETGGQHRVVRHGTWLVESLDAAVSPAPQGSNPRQAAG